MIQLGRRIGGKSESGRNKLMGWRIYTLAALFRSLRGRIGWLGLPGSQVRSQESGARNHADGVYASRCITCISAEGRFVTQGIGRSRVATRITEKQIFRGMHAWAGYCRLSLRERAFFRGSERSQTANWQIDAAVAGFMHQMHNLHKCRWPFVVVRH